MVLNWDTNIYTIFSYIVLQITTSATKQLWEKSAVGEMKMPISGPLAPWRDTTWSTQGEGILPSTHRPYPHKEINQNPGILR